MFNLLYQIIRTARPRQWLKNAAVFAPAFFSGLLFIKTVNQTVGKSTYEMEVFSIPTEAFTASVQAFLVFCALSSATYFMNDIKDAEKDKNHPIKKNRPIASGKLSKGLAAVISIALALGALVYSNIYINKYFTIICLTYLLMQVFYSFYLRQVIILESLIVAAGFILRVFAGSVASYSSISSWLLLTTVGLSLLMAFGKRRSEKTILAQKSMSESNRKPEVETRTTLRHYPDSLLDSMISISATFCLMSYSIFTFQTVTKDVNSEVSKFLPTFLTNPKWMMVTIPIVIYGVARYLYIIYEKKDAESPERILLSDKPLLLTVVVWAITAFSIIYVFHHYIKVVL